MALQRPLKRTTLVTRYEAAYAQIYGGYRIETRSGPKLLAPHNFVGKNASYFYSYASKTKNPPTNELVNKVVRSLKKSGKDAPMERLRVRGAVLGVYKLKDCSYEEAKLAAGTDVHVEEGLSQYLLIEKNGLLINRIKFPFRRTRMVTHRSAFPTGCRGRTADMGSARNKM
jgi:hypothetical protein